MYCNCGCRRRRVHYDTQSTEKKKNTVYNAARHYLRYSFGFFFFSVLFNDEYSNSLYVHCCRVFYIILYYRNVFWTSSSTVIVDFPRVHRGSSVGHIMFIAKLKSIAPMNTSRRRSPLFPTGRGKVYYRDNIVIKHFGNCGINRVWRKSYTYV